MSLGPIFALGARNESVKYRCKTLVRGWPQQNQKSSFLNRTLFDFINNHGWPLTSGAAVAGIIIPSEESLQFGPNSLMIPPKSKPGPATDSA